MSEKTINPIVKPIPLNESFVNKVFDYCKATVEDSPKECTTGIIFSQMGGYTEEEEKVFIFNKDRIEESKKLILYLLGQLKCSNDTSKPIRIETMIVKYNDKAWTNKPAVVFELLYLANAANFTSFALKNLDHSIVISSEVIPTVSPADKNFPEWWEEHKSEWSE